ncbi:MAG: hypothetical protein LKJ80_08290 [Oscillibacter sp.]|jgi:hypothetical protein|nr:hypothetical protein [Oscillibacter sp.]
MQKNLEHFYIGDACGGNQDWFRDRMMKLGGCAAVCACDTCIYLARTRGLAALYPFDANALTREDYIRFSQVMKPYLRPRWEGIDRTELYTEGFSQYLRDRGETRLSMTALPGSRPGEEAQTAVAAQIDDGLPVPCLLLKHRDPALDEYVWHWFLFTGYQRTDTDFLVRATTYGTNRVLSLPRLWDTGFRRRGGLILYRMA